MQRRVERSGSRDEHGTSGRTDGHAATTAGRDRGAATVLAAFVSIVLIAAVWLGCQLGTAVIARKQVEGAADLAALAAAGHSAQGQQEACRSAGWVVGEMRVRMVSCRLLGSDARVEVRAPIRGPRSGFPANVVPVRARARAGPVGEEALNGRSDTAHHEALWSPLSAPARSSPLSDRSSTGGLPKRDGGS